MFRLSLELCFSTRARNHQEEYDVCALCRLGVGAEEDGTRWIEMQEVSAGAQRDVGVSV